MKFCCRELGEAIIRILLVEDDPELARRLADALGGEGFVVEHAAKGQMGYDLGRTEAYDAAILDLGLPDMSGLEVLQQWRKAGNDMPVLILTARGSWTEKVEGLQYGGGRLHYKTLPRTGDYRPSARADPALCGPQFARSGAQ